eukprot:CAMPEP_0119414308 /NCGR_PEP_ID=MMETSP1335-20130426/6793_1 /TAXON_ID=259385 /ORGANISM="Chrysoculter rhomboideus, Strain RCC1486" /LENGTH=67 /DNA_ID=CAMNT_0007439181 /DNA_START=15 /DNA_END=214 /DNA_ORIENTATION=+
MTVLGPSAPSPSDRAPKRRKCKCPAKGTCPLTLPGEGTRVFVLLIELRGGDGGSESAAATAAATAAA